MVKDVYCLGWLSIIGQGGRLVYKRRLKTKDQKPKTYWITFRQDQGEQMVPLVVSLTNHGGTKIVKSRWAVPLQLAQGEREKE
jgi:hypothetical protein